MEKRRKSYLIIYVLPENCFLPNQLQQLSIELNITGTEITKFMTLGQLPPIKTRPAHISIKDIKHRNSFLSRSKNLRQSNVNYVNSL